MENRPNHPVRLRSDVGLAILELVELLLERNSRLGEEAQAPVLLPKRNHAVLQQLIDCGFDFRLQRGRVDCRLEERSDIACGDGEIFENLENGDRFGHFLVELLARKPLRDPVHPSTMCAKLLWMSRRNEL